MNLNEIALSLLVETNTSTHCSPFNCTGQVATNSIWDIVNPLMFFTDDNALCQYADIDVCCDLSSDSDGGNIFSFLKPFCLDLLPFCIFYSFMRVIISIVNYYFIYKKKIEFRLDKQSQSLLSDKAHYLSYFKGVLKFSFVIDIINAILSFVIFKGYQFYASCYYTDETKADLSLLGNYVQGDKASLILLFIFVILWYITESAQVYIQIFSVSTLTHLDNLVKERQRDQESKFYQKHSKWAMWWAIVFFLIGGSILTFNFFWELWTGNNSFSDYKLYYKYFSTYTVTFWLCYTLVLILVLTDRLLSYEGFKKREEFRNDGKLRMSTVRGDKIIDETNYQLTQGTGPFNDVIQALKEKFPNRADEDISAMGQKIADIYNSKMADHLDNLKAQMQENPDEGPTIETSMSYVKYLRHFNGFILIGYVMVLLSYQNDQVCGQEGVKPTEYLPLYLGGFIISSVATFAYELTHNYLLYRSYFLQILNKVPN